MDTFIEKIVAKKRNATDGLVTAGIVLGSLILIFIIMNVQVLAQLGIGLFLTVGIIYLAYRFITSRNVEFEYVVTNGDLDIDRIVARRKRKRIFSASCKEFDVVARVSSSGFAQAAQNVKTKIDATSSPASPDAFYVTLNYKGDRTMVLFEPDQRMLNNFKTFIPRKILLN